MVALTAAIGARAWGATAADGERAFDTGQFEAARAIWADLAEQDDAGGMLGLGLLFDLGRGVPPDPQQALFWYRRAGEFGLAAGAFNAAVMLDAGRGTARDAASAALWYARAAAAGHPRAEYDLAQLYAAGDGVPANPVVAAAWFGAAARAGLAAAAEHLARLSSRTGSAGAGAPVLPSGFDPSGGVALPCGRADSRNVALTWSAPPEPSAARYFVEVVAIGAGAATPAYSGYTELSALPVRLPAPGHYAWRVYVVDPSARRYLAAPWQSFHIERPDAPYGEPASAGPPAPASAG